MPNLLISILGPRKFSQILTIVDTGSEETILSYKDATLLQLPFKDLPIVKKIYGVSGNGIGLCEYKKGLKLYLKKEDNSSMPINMENIYISTNSLGLIHLPLKKSANFVEKECGALCALYA